MSKVATSLLLSASTFINPAKPTTLPFDASAYVTVNHQIRVSVEKTAEVPVTVLLRNTKNEVLFQKNIGRRDAKYAVKLNVNELVDGQYELEIKSSEGSIRKQLNLSTRSVEKSTRTIAMQ